ncbi:MAG TPA: cytochrome P450 [Egibacteraceae bacterium]|nr:cytochrome P450 [Egibacteraceae bacterium]
MVPFDPADPAFVRDPYPVYARLRREPGLVRHERGGMWLVARHAEVDAVFRDRRLGRVFEPRTPQDFYAPWNLVNVHSMLEMEPPDHTRLRGLVAREFTPRRVEALRAHIGGLVDALLDPIAERGGGDLVAELAEPLPVAVIAELLGFPDSDRHLLRPWSGDIVSLYELEPQRGADERAVRAAREFGGYLRELIAARRREPGPDLFSALVQLTDEGDRLTEDELVATAVLLLNAGHEASVNVMANGVLALLRHPEQMARLAADPSLAPTAVEELIRYDSPLSLFTRTALEDVEVGGQALAAGEVVGLLLGAANRDPAAFAEPDRVDVGRKPNNHVGFGAGIHYCLGAPLARVELQEGLARLLGRFPRMALAEEPQPRPTFQFRGYRSLRVAV